MKSFEIIQTFSFRYHDEMMSIEVLKSIFNNKLTFLEWVYFAFFQNLKYAHFEYNVI